MKYLLLSFALVGCSLDTKPEHKVVIQDRPDAGNADSDGSVPGLIPGADSAVEETPDATIDAVETCNGLDDDGNGRIDDVDVGHDGICDCLNICTVGEIGPWGQGDVFSAWLDARSPIPARRLDTDSLTDEGLAPCQVLIVLHIASNPVKGFYGPVDGHKLPDGAVGAVERAVSRGMGVMSTSGYNNSDESEVDNVNTLLAPFDVSYNKNSRYLSGDISDFEESPTTAWVGKLYEQNGIEAMGGLPVAHYPDGSNALVISENERVVVWAGEWVTYQATWQNLDYGVEQFWTNVLGFLAPPQTCEIPQLQPE